jgi:transposase-like protein
MEMSTSLEGSPVGAKTEVVAKAQRRRFPAAEKLRILREAEGCKRPGELGALLRREGLFSSHLAKWRAARKRGELAGLAARRRGPQAQRPDPQPELLETMITVINQPFPAAGSRAVKRVLPCGVWQG